LSDDLEALDADLAQFGETVTLKRRIGTGVSFVSLTCRASVRVWMSRKGNEPIGDGPAQIYNKVTFSPTDLNPQVWPGAAGGSPYPAKGDFIVVKGVAKAIEACNPIMVNDTLVRLDCLILG
jgi:hypothetical protein